jgi:3'-phosphoadenosine 5'-phosphosulfate sulfotransferase (PAPS reductase)/FAD synthetase
MRGHQALDYVQGTGPCLDDSYRILAEARTSFNPTHIVSMVSGGKDSAASHGVLMALGVNPDLVIHGNTRCGIPETSKFVEENYGKNSDFVVSDAGTAYEDYVLRKGFFGVGIAAHGFSYRVLKATPFRKTISRHIRKGRRNIRILLINGARKDESENRKKNLKVLRPDPAQKGNIWTNIIHNWTQQQRDIFLEENKVIINPVAVNLCRSGECMCGTMQSKGERLEASILYPGWGRWLDSLEEEAINLHGFGWGDQFPKKRDKNQGDLFQPMCRDCVS